MLSKKRKFFNHYPFFSLFFLWSLLQTFLFLHFGIVTDFEAEKYINQAEFFLEHGRFETGNFVFYSTQILLISAVKKLQIGYELIILLQTIFNALSVFCFYKIIKLITEKNVVAFWFTFFFLIMYYYHLYNVYLFTESLYFSFSIIYFYGLLRITRLSLLNLIAIVVGLAILYFTRPVGIFFIPTTFLFIVLKFYPEKSLIILSTSGLVGALGFLFILNNSLNSGGELDFLLPYIDERIICGVPTISNENNIIVPVEKNSIQGLFYIIISNYELFLKLSFKRLIAFFGVIRPYYSSAHNIFIAVYFYSLYFMIINGYINWSKKLTPEISFMICLISFAAITTALSCDEWHNRFILAILPFFLFLASLSFKKK